MTAQLVAIKRLTSVSILSVFVLSSICFIISSGSSLIDPKAVKVSCFAHDLCVGDHELLKSLPCFFNN